jgi:cell wall-associated NlpC family hydrolase
MATTTTTKLRTLHLANPLLRGPDVKALQQLLAPYKPGPADGQYGQHTAAAVARAKWALGYPKPRCDEVADAKLVAYLEGTPVPAGFAARQQARRAEAAQTLTLRQKIVANAQWGIAHEPQIHYEQLRPMDGLKTPRKLPLHTDCSGFATLCYAWAGAPDPNGLGYSGQGWTGTLLQHMKAIAAEAVQPGDLVVWGAPPGHHVALALEAGPDPLLCSHGQEKGPIAIRFSVESAYQPKPATWLSCLP